MKNFGKAHLFFSGMMLLFIGVSFVYIIGSFPLRLYKYTPLGFWIFFIIALLLIVLILKTCPPKK